MKIILIVAMTEDRVIGKGGQVPWHLPEDLRFFKRTTLGHAIIMGRKTYESIGRPLPQRRNIVITRKADYAPSRQVATSQQQTLSDDSARETRLDIVHSPRQALELCRSRNESKAFIIGGGEIYAQTLPWADEMIITRIQDQHIDGDTFFPQWDEAEWTCQGPADANYPHARLYRRTTKDGTVAIPFDGIGN